MKAILITVRTGSTRLPNKSTLKIKDKHTIEYVIDNVKKSKYADKIILCTTDLEEDKILCDIADRNNIDFYRGDEHNKLKRWYEACIKHSVTSFATADGDDLFYDAGLADLCFEQLKNNILIDGQGLYNDVYGINTFCLSKLLGFKSNDIIEPHNIVDCIKNDPILFHHLKVKRISNVPDIFIKNDIRMTLDYKEDFEFFKKVIEYLPNDKFGLSEIISYINDNPEIKNINNYLEEQWQVNQQK